jgi:hypothetical protein
MKKTSPKKIALSRETLRHLEASTDGGKIAVVQAGAFPYSISVCVTCPPTYRVC